MWRQAPGLWWHQQGYAMWVFFCNTHTLSASEGTVRSCHPTRLPCLPSTGARNVSFKVFLSHWSDKP